MKVRSTRRSATRRTLFSTVAVFAAAALGLAGCSGSSSGNSNNSEGTAAHPVTITMWDWVDSSAAIKLFEKSHPSIKVKLDLVAAGAPTYAKMFAAIKAGNAPDVGLIELKTLPQFIGTGGLLDLSKYGANDVKSDFVDWAWSQVSNGGGVYALPLSASPIGYHYNTKLLAQYGITSIPKTYAELATDAKIYHQNNPNGYLIDVPPTTDYLALLTWQDGGRWFKADGNKWEVGFTSKESEQVANYLQGFVDNKDAYTEASFMTPWYQALSSGNLASFVGPQWSDALLESQVASQKGNFKVAEAPQWNAGTHVDGQEGGGSLAVFKDTKYPKAAYTFVNWMLTNPQAQLLNYNSGYGWPTTHSGSQLKVLNAPIAYFGNQNPGPIYAASNSATDQSWQFGPNYSTVTTDLNGYLAQALSGQMTIWQAMQKEQATELSRLKDAGISAVSAP
jgi:multiple sugar transport system substrate-binding protein